MKVSIAIRASGQDDLFFDVSEISRQNFGLLIAMTAGYIENVRERNPGGLTTHRIAGMLTSWDFKEIDSRYPVNIEFFLDDSSLEN